MVPVHQGNTIYQPAFFLFSPCWFLIPHRRTCGWDKVNTPHNSGGGGVVDDDDVFLLCKGGKGGSILCNCKYKMWKISAWNSVWFNWTDGEQMRHKLLRLEERKKTSPHRFSFLHKSFCLTLKSWKVFLSYIHGASDSSIVQETKQ